MKRIPRAKIDRLTTAYFNLLEYLDEQNTEEAEEFQDELEQAWTHVSEVIYSYQNK